MEDEIEEVMKEMSFDKAWDLVDSKVSFFNLIGT